MPKQLMRDAYCSAPPLSSVSFLPPRLSREQEAGRPRTPLVLVKREVKESSIESVEFFVDDEEDKKPPIKVEIDPRQLRAGVASLMIRPPQSSASASSSMVAAAPGPSRCEHRTEALCRIPAHSLGPADSLKGQGRPKGSKSQPRIVFGLTTLPEREAKIEAEKNLAKMKSAKQV